MIKISKFIHRVLKLIAISLLFMNFLPAEVRFDLRFTDPDGEGFNASKNEWMKNAVTEGANFLGKCIEQNAFVTIEVKSMNSGYAKSCPLYTIISKKAESIVRAMDKILNEDNKFSGLWEGKIEFNIEKFGNHHTLKRVTIHELTHTLGFVSRFTRDAQDFLSFFKRYQNYHASLDQLIVDSHERPLIIDNGWIWSNYKYNTDFDSSMDVFACGPNIKKRNGGKCVKLYNPETFVPSSSFSHLDTATYPKNILNHLDEPNRYPMWNKYEIGIMEDLGYKIDWENYCKAVVNNRTLNVNMDALQGANCWFWVKKMQNNDFPEECYNEKKAFFYDNFSIQFYENSKLQLFFKYNETYREINIPVDFNDVLRVRISDKDYQVKIENDRGSSNINVSFFEIKEDKVE